MPGPSSISRTWSRVRPLLISACEPARSTTAMSSAPEPAMVLPLPLARKASSTITTSATATTVDSDSQKRCGMLLMLIFVTAAICRSKASGQSSSERGGDLQAHGVDRRDDSVAMPSRSISASAAR